MAGLGQCPELGRIGIPARCGSEERSHERTCIGSFVGSRPATARGRSRSHRAAPRRPRTRPAGSVQLVAVSKTFGAEDIAPVLEAGQRVFGENRVQEAMGKWPGLRERFPGVELHLIGPLQTNKVREAVALFDVIETLDRESLAVALASRTRQAGQDWPACSCR